MYRTAFFLLASLLLCHCRSSPGPTPALPYYNAADFTPLFLQNPEEVKRKVPHRIADFAFLNQDSQWISQRTIEGKIHVADFMFTTCSSICPVLTRNLKRVSDSLGNDPGLVILSFSVTPWIDRPQVLRRYRERYDIRNPNWHFLTGERGALYHLARTSYFAEEDLGFSRDSSEFLHTEHVLLVDGNRRIRGIYNGTLALDMDQLVRDIRTLQEEARNER